MRCRVELPSEQVKIQAGNQGAECMTDTPGGHQYVAARSLMWPLRSGEKRSGTKPGWGGSGSQEPWGTLQEEVGETLGGGARKKDWTGVSREV